MTWPDGQSNLSGAGCQPEADCQSAFRSTQPNSHKRIAPQGSGLRPPAGSTSANFVELTPTFQPWIPIGILDYPITKALLIYALHREYCRATLRNFNPDSNRFPNVVTQGSLDFAGSHLIQSLLLSARLLWPLFQSTAPARQNSKSHQTSGVGSEASKPSSSLSIRVRISSGSTAVDNHLVDG